MKGLIRNIFFLSLLVGCNKFGAKSYPPGAEFTFKTTGTIHGIAQSDWDCVFDVSFTSDTLIQINTQYGPLNQYEFGVKDHQVCFGKDVELKDGKLIYQVPPIPAVPKGTTYTIEFDN